MDKFFYDLEISLLKPEVRSSRDELDKLIADDFMEFGSSGGIYYKKDTVENLSLSVDKVQFTVSDFKARELSEDLVQTTFKTEKIINDVQKIISLRSSIWKRIGGNWQMIFHQGTVVSKQSNS